MLDSAENIIGATGVAARPERNRALRAGGMAFGARTLAQERG
jgi:hypothetical protein